MPRPGPRRPLIGVRLSAEQIAALDKLIEPPRTRSDVIRAAVDAYLRTKLQPSTKKS